jgi:hypothetical protein
VTTQIPLTFHFRDMFHRFSLHKCLVRSHVEQSPKEEIVSWTDWACRSCGPHFDHSLFVVTVIQIPVSILRCFSGHNGSI